MSELKKKVAENASKALDMVVTKIPLLKRSIENMQNMAINAQLDAVDLQTTAGIDAMLTRVLATQHIVQKLELLIGDLDAMIEEIQDLIVSASIQTTSKGRNH